MPLEELEKLVLQATDDVNLALQQQGVDLGIGTGAPMGAGAPPAQGAELSLVTPELIQKASDALMAAGILPGPVAEMSPEFMELLVLLADAISPGVYNLQNEDDLVEFLNGIATGIIALPAIPGAPGAGGAVQGGPPAEAVGGPPVAAPGGVPGTTPAAGPGIIPGT